MQDTTTEDLFAVDPLDYLVQAVGDRLRGDGILAGDHVVIHPQDTAEAGQLVLAAVDRVGVLKHHEAGEPVLGVVVKVIGRRA
jgi:SOS-response transcriptional repressor LexA